MLKKYAAPIMGLILAKADFLVPFKKVAANERWVAYRHPRPAYPVHFIILPRAGWKSIFECPFEEPRLMSTLLQLTARLIQDAHLDSAACRLVINGGAYQTAPIMHAHLISG